MANEPPWFLVFYMMSAWRGLHMSAAVKPSDRLCALIESPRLICLPARRPARQLPAYVLAVCISAAAISLLVAGVARWLQVVPAPGAEGNSAQQELVYDLRGEQPLPDELRPAGALHLAKLRREPEGFRITLAGDRPNPMGRAGLELKTTVHGDFDLVAAYELLAHETPTDGYGVGFEFFAHTMHTPQQGMGVYRVSRVKQGDGYLVSRNYLQDDGQVGYKQRFVPGTVKSGRLRLTRTGTTATAWAAEREDGEFQKLAEYDLEPDDLKVIWLMAFTGHAQYPLDLRLTWLKVRSASSSAAAAPAIATAAAPPAPTRSWRLLALLLALLIVVAAVVAYVVRRNRADART